MSLTKTGWTACFDFVFSVSFQICVFDSVEIHRVCEGISKSSDWSVVCCVLESVNVLT